MNKKAFISIQLIILGFVLEFVHFWTDLEFFKVKFWVLGVVSMLLGVLGLIWFGVIPLLEKRAKTLGKFKKKSMKRKTK